LILRLLFQILTLPYTYSSRYLLFQILTLFDNYSFIYTDSSRYLLFKILTLSYTYSSRYLLFKILTLPYTYFFRYLLFKILTLPLRLLSIPVTYSSSFFFRETRKLVIGTLLGHGRCNQLKVVTHKCSHSGLYNQNKEKNQLYIHERLLNGELHYCHSVLISIVA